MHRFSAFDFGFQAHVVNVIFFFTKTAIYTDYTTQLAK